MIPIADRTVRVNLLMQAAGYIAGAEAAAAKTRDLGSEAEKLASKKAAFETLGRGALILGAGVAAGVGLAVKAAADFDQAMSFVQAANHESASSMEALRKAAIKAGQDTVFSATEAANAEEELAKAGITTSDVLGGALTGALNLATAGGLGVADAAGIAATTLQQFQMRGDQASHVADLLAAGAGKAMGSVSDLSEGLKYVGPVAHSMGISLEETVGTLALFAQSGIVGEQAGTSLRGMLSSLTSPSAQASKEIERLGITLYDSQGKFLGLENAAGELSGAYSTMDGASRDASLGVIFGNQQVTAARVLFQAGAEGVDRWTSAVNDSGYAADTARIRMNNLKGDIEQLSGSVETALIKTGSAADGFLRGGVQGLTNLVNGYAQLPEPAQAAALGVGSVGAAASVAAGLFFLAVPKVAAFNVALESMGPKGQAAGAALKGVGTFLAGPWGIALGVGLAALLAWNEGNQRFQQGVQDVAATLEEQTGAIEKNTREYVANQLAQAGAFEGARQAGISSRELTDAVLNGGAAYTVVNGKLQDYNNSLGGMFNPTVGNTITAVRTLHGQVELAPQAWADMKAATEGATGATDAASVAAAESASALAAMSGAAQSAQVDVSGLADTIRGFGSAQLDTNAASRQLEQAVDDVATTVQRQRDAYEAAHGSLDGFNTSLDIGSQEGRDNQAALDDMAKSTLQLAAATVTQTGKQEDANGVIASGRQRLIEMLGQFGITGAEADAYADRLGLIPGNVDTAVDLQTASAESALATFRANLAALPTTKQVTIIQSMRSSGIGQFSDGPPRAHGGILPGAPSSRDNMLIAAASGEFVTRASQAAIPSNRRALEFMNAGGVMAGFAAGGMVGSRGGRTVDGPPVQYVPGGPSGGAPVVVSLAGARFTFEVDGRQITGVIRDQVVAYDADRQRASSAGWSVNR